MPHLESLQELIGNTLKGIRRFVQDLRPPTLDHLGLMATLEGLASDLREKDGIETELGTAGRVRRLAPEEELVLFRIAQEALNNALKHAKANQIILNIHGTPELVTLEIIDDGVGFDPDQEVEGGGLGLDGMIERAEILGGKLSLTSHPGKGTHIKIEVPNG